MGLLFGLAVLGLFGIWARELDCRAMLCLGEGRLGFEQVGSENGFGLSPKIRIKINKDNNTIVITIVKIIMKSNSESKK